MAFKQRQTIQSTFNAFGAAVVRQQPLNIMGKYRVNARYDLDFIVEYDRSQSFELARRFTPRAHESHRGASQRPDGPSYAAGQA
jgi:hypothetical protein